LKTLITIILCLGFFITFHNTTDKKMHYWLWWVSHPFNYLSPVNLAGGELEAGKVNTLSHEYQAGDYIASWASADYQDDYESDIKFITTEKTTIVTTKPGEVFSE